MIHTFRTPKNFKKGKLIAGQYRTIDLMILIMGVVMTIAGLLIYLGLFEGKSMIITVLLIIPAAAGFALTLPFGIYHNMMEYLILKYKNATSIKTYIWEGIYRYDDFNKENV